METGMMATAHIIDGKERAARLRRDIAIGVKRLRDETGVTAKLTAILVGDDPASAIYVRRKGEQAAAAGMASETHRLDSSISQDDLLALIDRLNRDETVHGILVQLPLPPHIDKTAVLRRIDPGKDVDGFHPVNVGLLASDGEAVDGRIIPCTPMGCMMLLADELGSLEGLNAVVVGCSNIVGRPMAQLLLQARCTVSIAHIHSQRPRCRDAPSGVPSQIFRRTSPPRRASHRLHRTSPAPPDSTRRQRGI